MLAAALAEAAGRQLEVDNRGLEAKVEAFGRQMSALQPELVATLKTLGNQDASAELTKNLSPLAILGGGNVAEVLERLLRSLPVGIGEAPQPGKAGTGKGR